MDPWHPKPPSRRRTVELWSRAAEARHQQLTGVPGLIPPFGRDA